MNSDQMEMSLPIDLSSLTMLPIMSEPQPYNFCRRNSDLRIERNANGEVTLMSLAFADTGHRNGRIFAQMFNWAEQNDHGKTFDSSTGFTLPNGAIRSAEIR